VSGATNFGEFSSQLKGFANLSKKQAVDAQRKTALTVLRGVILGNPVDTGRMRAAWVATAGAPATGEGGGDSIGTLAFGQDVWVVNNVAYSGWVNLHHPTKAGFVDAVVANVAAAFDSGASA
jgi:hypothetical protein